MTSLGPWASDGSTCAPLTGRIWPRSWTLPSGEQLLHYALKGGFLAPSILTPAKTAPAKGGEGKR